MQLCHKPICCILFYQLLRIPLARCALLSKNTPLYFLFSFSLCATHISFLPGLLCDKVPNDATPFHTHLALFCTYLFFPRVGLYCSSFNCSAKSRLQGCGVASLIDLHISRGKAISLIKERSWTKDDPCFCGNS